MAFRLLSWTAWECNELLSASVACCKLHWAFFCHVNKPTKARPLPLNDSWQEVDHQDGAIWPEVIAMNEAVPKVSKTRFDSDTIALDKTFHGAPSGQSSEAQTTKQRTHEPLNKELNITGAPELRFTF